MAGAAFLRGLADIVMELRGPQVSPGYTDAARDAGMFEAAWLVSGDLGHVDAKGLSKQNRSGAVVARA